MLWMPIILSKEDENTPQSAKKQQPKEY